MCVKILGVCLLAAQITGVDINQNTNLGVSYEGAQGGSYSTSHLYEDEQVNVSANGYLILDTDTRLDLGFSNGIDTAKYDVSKSYTVGVTQYFQLMDTKPGQLEGTGLGLVLSGSTTFGGKERHTACTGETASGDTSSNFYCLDPAGLGFDQIKFDDYEQPYSVGARLTYRF